MPEPATRSPQPAPAFGSMLKAWRHTRGTSQLDLALLCGMSQKHVSFLESGRSRPSRGMVLHLASALSVPLRDQNAMLVAAGFAPVYKERSLEAPEMRAVERAFAQVLQQQEPYPALVVDRTYSILRANRAMGALMAFLLGASGAAEASARPNLVALVLGPDQLRGAIENWDEVATWMLRRLRAEAMLEGRAAKAHAELLERVRTFPDVAAIEHALRDDRELPPTLVVRLRKGDVRLSLFSLIASLGTPLDVTLQTVHLELFFPADDASERWLRGSGQATG